MYDTVQTAPYLFAKLELSFQRIALTPISRFFFLRKFFSNGSVTMPVGTLLNT
jgi:hypothetical protein